MEKRSLHRIPQVLKTYQNIHVFVRLMMPILLLLSFLPLDSFAQEQSQFQAEDLVGAWTSSFTISDTTYTQVSIVDESYVSISVYNETEKLFFGTYGGKWELKDGELLLTFEFHTYSPDKVGTTVSTTPRIEGEVLRFDDEKRVWERMDDGSPGDLAGAWLITGRVRDGELRSRQIGPRKTMKILSGTRFQWIAYNTETKEFRGTGGGTYTTVDGKYTETIEFFSRDGSRVGAVLPFDFSLQDGAWHHEGLSSKGQPIHEVWTLRTVLDGRGGEGK